MDRNLEVHTSLLHYCTFGLGAADDEQNIRANTAHGKDGILAESIKNGNVTLLQMPEDTIIQFISL